MGAVSSQNESFCNILKILKKNVSLEPCVDVQWMSQLSGLYLDPFQMCVDIQNRFQTKKPGLEQTTIDFVCSGCQITLKICPERTSRYFTYAGRH